MDRVNRIKKIKGIFEEATAEWADEHPIAILPSLVFLARHQEQVESRTSMHAPASRKERGLYIDIRRRDEH